MTISDPLKSTSLFRTLLTNLPYKLRLTYFLPWGVQVDPLLCVGDDQPSLQPLALVMMSSTLPASCQRSDADG